MFINIMISMLTYKEVSDGTNEKMVTCLMT